MNNCVKIVDKPYYTIKRYYQNTDAKKLPCAFFKELQKLIYKHI